MDQCLGMKTTYGCLVMRIWLDMIKAVNNGEWESVLNVKKEDHKDVHVVMTRLIQLGYKASVEGKFLTVKW